MKRSMLNLAFVLISTMLGYVRISHAIDAACTQTTNLSIYRCPENSVDWYDSYTGIVDNLEAFSSTMTTRVLSVLGPSTFGTQAGTTTFVGGVGGPTFVSTTTFRADIGGVASNGGLGVTGTFTVGPASSTFRADASARTMRLVGRDNGGTDENELQFIRRDANVQGAITGVGLGLQFDCGTAGCYTNDPWTFQTGSTTTFRADIGGVAANGGLGVATALTVAGSSLTVTAGAAFATVSGSVGIGTVAPGTKVHMSSGTLTVDGTSPAIVVGSPAATPVQGSLIVHNGAAQTIAGGNTITADACGGIKTINAAAAVSTSLTDTFTAPGAANRGCCMDITNIDTVDTITLDTNANFNTSGGLDVALTPCDVVRVCSDGTDWYQVAAAVANTCN